MHRTLVLAMVLVSSFASTVASATPVFGKVHAVKITLRNETGAELKLNAGATPLELAPGQSMTVKMPAGQSIVAAEATSHFTQGEQVSLVSQGMNGYTLSIR